MGKQIKDLDVYLLKPQRFLKQIQRNEIPTERVLIALTTQGMDTLNGSSRASERALIRDAYSPASGTVI